MTIGEAMDAWAAELQAAGCPEPQREALLIAAHLLEDEPGRVAARRREPLPAGVEERAREIIEQRRQRRPLQYILGEAYFYGLRLKCDQRAAIPRPETELLVDAALEELRRRADKRTVVADIGTGTGCVAIAIAANWPSAQVVGVEVDFDAWAVAYENMTAYGLWRGLHLIRGEGAKVLAELGMAELVEMLVANLPYVAEDEWETLAPEVKCEPRGALVAGPTGAEAYEQLAEELHLLPNLQWFAVELSATRPELIKKAFVGRGFELETRRDYAGHERVLIGRRVEG